MRALRVVLADGGSVARADLLRLAEGAGFEVVGEAPEWRDVLSLVSTRSADLIVAAGSPEFLQTLAAVDSVVPGIVVTPDAASAKDYVSCGAFAIVPVTTEPEVLAATASVAAARATDLAAARHEIATLKDALEARKLVERAKGVLMKRLGITEDQAYRRMQKASQDENRKLRDIADAILAAERLYEAGGEHPR